MLDKTESSCQLFAPTHQACTQLHTRWLCYAGCTQLHLVATSCFAGGCTWKASLASIVLDVVVVVFIVGVFVVVCTCSCTSCYADLRRRRASQASVPRFELSVDALDLLIQLLIFSEPFSLLGITQR